MRPRPARREVRPGYRRLARANVGSASNREPQSRPARLVAPREGRTAARWPSPSSAPRTRCSPSVRPRRSRVSIATRSAAGAPAAVCPRSASTSGAHGGSDDPTSSGSCSSIRPAARAARRHPSLRPRPDRGAFGRSTARARTPRSAPARRSFGGSSPRSAARSTRSVCSTTCSTPRGSCSGRTSRACGSWSPATTPSGWPRIVSCHPRWRPSSVRSGAMSRRSG